ncbi:MAG: hypothetical protein DCC67_15940 [Planctomycetota bacterium]|nr:MAG: hypothetical protein DCC67_15940 [Planctomycetota bacterium]
MKTVHASRSSVVDDPRLVELIDEITQQLQSGAAVDAQQYIERYPEYAEQLNNWLTVMRAMVELGESVGTARPARRSASVHPAGAADPPAARCEQPPADADGHVTGVLGDFCILRELGRGGMGVVYEAEQISLGRRVALKVLPFAAMLDKQQLARFKNEARAAATLEHPNIVAIHSVGQERGVHYYAMQLIEGRSLAEVIGELRGSLGSGQSSVVKSADQVATNKGRGATDTQPMAAMSTLPEFDSREYFRTVARLGIQAAEALDHAHQNGVLHRDVKPANLLVECSHLAPRHGAKPLGQRGGKAHLAERNDYMKLWITDFGLARIEHDAGMTMTGDVVGTLRYMSPEQISGQRAVVDHRCDIYSLGVTLYELLVRQAAFNGKNAERLLRQVVDEYPPAPRSLDNAIPFDLETIVLKAMRKDPAERYASAQELADDLRRFLDARPVIARRPNARRRIANWIRRNPQLSFAIGVFAVAFSLTASLAAWSVDRARRDAAYQRAALAQRNQMYRQAETIAREQVYAMRMHFAGYSAQASYLEQAAQALDDLKPAPDEADLRGFEWHYLANLCRNAPLPFGRHQGEAYAAAFSPDESRLATSGADGVRIWAWPDRIELAHLRDAQGDVNGVAWSPDDARLASFSDDCIARIYQAGDWSLQSSLRLPGRLVGGRFTPDGAALVIAERKESAGDGATLGENRIHVYDSTSWRSRATLDAPGEMLQGIAVSSDGQFVAAIAHDSLRIWDLQSQHLVHRLPQKLGRSVAFARNSPRLAVGVQGEVRLYDASSGKLLRVIAPVDSPEGLAFGPNDRSLVTVGRIGVAYLWRQAPNGAWHESGAFAQNQPLWGVAVDRHGEFVTTDRAGGVWRWDGDSSQEARHIVASPEFVERWLAAESPAARSALDYADAAARWANEEPATMGAATAVAWSPARDEAVVASASGRLTIWDGELQEPIAIAPTGIVGLATVTWSPDGRWLAASTPESIALAERATLRVVASIAVDRSPIAPLVAFSSDGTTLFASWHRPGVPTRGRAAYRVPSFEEAPHLIPSTRREANEFIVATDHDLTRWIEEPPPDPVGPISSEPRTTPALAASLDGRTVLFAKLGGVIDAIHTFPLARRVQIAAGFNPYQPVALSPDGRTLATVDDAGAINLWSTATGRKLFALTPRLPRTSAIRFSPDGSRLVAVGVGGFVNDEIVVWDAPRAPAPLPHSNGR